MKNRKSRLEAAKKEGAGRSFKRGDCCLPNLVVQIRLCVGYHGQGGIKFGAIPP